MINFTAKMFYSLCLGCSECSDDLEFDALYKIISLRLSGLHNRKQPWNPYADKSSQQTVSSNNTTKSGDFSLPQNSHEFQKYWRKCQKYSGKKYQYLTSIGGPLLAEIFKAEISMGLLGEVISIMNENWQEDDLTKICSILCSLSTVKRFSLSLQFLSEQEKSLLMELFRKMNKAIASLQNTDMGGVFSSDTLQTLELKYGLKDEQCE